MRIHFLLAVSLCAALPALAGPTAPGPTARAPAPAPAPSSPPPPAAPTKPWGKLLGDKGQSWELTKPEIVVGSDPSCDVVLGDKTVAPKHFRLRFSGGNATVEDLGGKHGTLVAGTAVKPGQLWKVLNNVEIDPGVVTLQFEFLERGTIEPTHSAHKKTPPAPRPAGAPAPAKAPQKAPPKVSPAPAK